MIELLINGEVRRVPAPLTLSQLIETLDLAGKRIAIERNGEIVVQKAAKRSYSGRVECVLGTLR